MSIARVWLVSLFALISGAAHAMEESPLFYTRAKMAIERQSPPPPLPWQDTATPNAIMFDIELRDGTVFYNQKGWFNLSRPADDSGLMLYFGAPVMAPVVNAPYYATLDILMIDAQGKILQILPSLQLASLDAEYYPADPIAAFLILPGGACERLSIHPGDYIVYKLFKRPPAMVKS